jgi:serine-type D-Ala-D-Ala carboxypeptidase/endopeptidase
MKNIKLFIARLAVGSLRASSHARGLLTKKMAGIFTGLLIFIMSVLMVSLCSCHEKSSTNNEELLALIPFFFSNNPAPPPTAEWDAVTQAIEDNRGNFSGGLAVEIATPDGVVYSYATGGFSNSQLVMVASGSKWVTATVLLMLVDQGILDLDMKMSDYLTDRNGLPWSGNMRNITLRNLLSFTSGISGDDLSTSTKSDAYTITLKEAVYRIYDEQNSAASTKAPGTYFYYGSTHMRIAARLAEIRTGKTWGQIFDEQLRVPLGWSSGSVFMNSAYNPNPAGGLKATGIEYMRFMMLQLRKGLDGTTRLLNESWITEQRKDQFLPATTISYSPYVAAAGLQYHYGLGNWRECASPGDSAACDAALRVSSTGTYGWGPWIDVQEDYAAIIMTKQPFQGTIVPSEDLKGILAGLIPGILAGHPPVIRPVP